MTSLFDRINGKIPPGVTTRDDVLEWLLEEGIYIHKDDDYIPFNQLCNQMDKIIMKRSTDAMGRVASTYWYEQAARNKMFGLLSECRSIASGFSFSIKLEKFK